MSDLRMPDINNVTLAGRLTRDPELKYLQSGAPVCKMGLAVTRYYRTKEGEKREETLFINVETWNKSAEFCGEHLRKGRPIIVVGRLKSDSWEDKTTGQKRTSIDVRADRIQMLDWDDSGSSPRPQSQSQSEPSHTMEPAPEDDVPF